MTLQKMNIFNNVMKMISAVKLFSSFSYFTEREKRASTLFLTFFKRPHQLLPFAVILVFLGISLFYRAAWYDMKLKGEVKRDGCHGGRKCTSK